MILRNGVFLVISWVTSAPDAIVVVESTVDKTRVD